eukprot:6296314-Pyramimonas_sp.AAC.1
MATEGCCVWGGLATAITTSTLVGTFSERGPQVETSGGRRTIASIDPPSHGQNTAAPWGAACDHCRSGAAVGSGRGESREHRELHRLPLDPARGYRSPGALATLGPSTDPRLP